METGKQAFEETLKYIARPYRSLMHPEFSEHSEMYTFSTENISGYLESLDVVGKNVLTVTASGDHLINLYLGGAHQVECYDMNNNTYFFSELKLAAIQALTYDDFLTFFTSCQSKDTTYMGLVSFPEPVGINTNMYSYILYQKIRPYLNNDVMEYWDLMYQEFNYDGVAFDKKGLLMGTSLNDAINNNAYLKNETVYLKTRELLKGKKSVYYNCDIFQLHTLPNTYDIILLSNIYDYVTNKEFGAGVMTDDFVEYAENGLKGILNSGGKIGITYQYHYKTKKNMINKSGLKRLFTNKYEFEKRPELDKYKFKKVLVPSIVENYRNDGGKDCLYVYEKERVR